jgi:hypothetical protein
MIGSSGAAVDAQPNPWPWAQQQAGMVQLTHSIPSEQQVPQTLQAPMAAGISNGNPVLLPQPVVPTGHAATTVANETIVPSENKKGEPKDTDGEAPEDGDSKKNKESKALKMFKLALADFVKEALKPTWKEGNLTREVHKTIVKKVVDKVTSTVENTPQSKEKIDVYMSYSKEKLSKLVQVTSASSSPLNNNTFTSLMFPNRFVSHAGICWQVCQDVISVARWRHRHLYRVLCQRLEAPYILLTV